MSRVHDAPRGGVRLRQMLAVVSACGVLAGCANTHAPNAGTTTAPSTRGAPSGAVATAPASAFPAAPNVPAPGTEAPGTARSSETATGAPAAGSPAAGSPAAPLTRSLTGRFAVQYEDRLGKPHNAYGNFAWQEGNAAVSLELRSPLGQTLAVIHSTSDGATLDIPGRAPRSAADVDTLMQQALGFALPVEGLRYWLQPAAEPDTPAETVRDPQHGSRIQQIRQDGWTIDYVAYADAPAAGPKRIDLARDTPPLAIKLVLDQ